MIFYLLLVNLRLLSLYSLNDVPKIYIRDLKVSQAWEQCIAWNIVPGDTLEEMCCQLKSSIGEHLVGDEHNNVKQDASSVITQQLENDSHLGDCAQLTYTVSKATDPNLEIFTEVIKRETVSEVEH